MASTLGFVFAGLMLINGVTYTLNPRAWFQGWNRYLRPFMPKGLNEDVDDLSRLPYSAGRFLAGWEVLVALMMAWLAMRARD